MKKFSILVFVAVFLLFPVFVLADSLVLTGADIVPVYSDTQYNKGNVFMYLENGSPSNLFIAPVHLPENAQVTSVVVFYGDFDPTGELSVNMWKTNIYTGASYPMGTWTSSGTPGQTTHKIAPISYGVSINNSGYAYTFTLNFTSNTADTNVRLYKLKINYR
jgi:hypothetical protein